MRYIAILDYHHLDESFFMKSFSEAMAHQRGCRAILLHADSPYTERILQTGILRRDATLRSTKDLNHRIVSLLADSNISATGVHGYQKKIVRYAEKKLHIDNHWFENMPEGTHLVLSNLIYDCESDDIRSVPLAYLATFLRHDLNLDAILIFPHDRSKKSASAPPNVFDASNNSPYDEFRDLENNLYNIPKAHKSLPDSCFFCSLEEFKKLPETTGLKKIHTKGSHNHQN